MKENLKIALDIIGATIKEVNVLIKLYRKNILTEEKLREKIDDIEKNYLINVLIYILSE